MTSGVGAWNQPKGGYHQNMIVPDKTASSYHYQRVRWAVVAIQRQLIAQGYLVEPTQPLGGGFGPATTKAVKEMQSQSGISVDGWVGPKTARHLFHPMVKAAQDIRGIPDNLLFGQARLESAMDPGAEGLSDDRDRGLFQFSRKWWPAVSDQMAFSDPEACASLSGDTLMNAYSRLNNWNAAVAYYNNPEKAIEWARIGHAPDEQIAIYVWLVYVEAGKPL